MLATQGEEEPVGFAVRLAARAERLLAGLRACVDCVTSEVRKIATTFIDSQQLPDIARREAAGGKNIAAAMWFYDASLVEIEQMLADGADVNRRMSIGEKPQS